MFFKERQGVSLFHEPFASLGSIKLDPALLGHLLQMQKPEIQTEAKLPDSNNSGAEGQHLEGTESNLTSGAAENQTAGSHL